MSTETRRSNVIRGRTNNDRCDWNYCREIDALENNDVRRYSPDNEPIVVYENRNE